MNDQRSDSITKVTDLPPSSLSEHLLNILKAALATAPFCGGIASLMSDYIPGRRVKRPEEFATRVGQDLEQLQERVNTAQIESDQFAFIFERCFRGASEFPQQERLEAFRGILINSVLPTSLSQDQQEFFLNLVERLSVIHLRILRFMAFPRSYLEAMGIPENLIHGGFSDFFPIALPDVGLEVIRSAFADLHALGLISTDAHIFNTMTAGQGLNLLGDRVTPLGKDFIGFCQAPTRQGN